MKSGLNFSEPQYASDFSELGPGWGMTFLHGTSILFVIIQKPTLVSKDLKRMFSLLYDVLVN